MTSRSVLLILLTTILSSAPARCAGQHQPAVPDGTVESAIGKWTYPVGTPIKDKAILPLPIIVLGFPDGTLRIWLVGEVRPFYCPASEKRCEILIPKYSGRDEGTNSWWDDVIPRLYNHRSKYVVAASRGLGDAIREAVVRMEDSWLDISPPFKGVIPGRYLVRLEPLSVSSKSENEIVVNWSGRGPSLVRATGLELGLYKLVLVDAAGEPTGADAWLLVTSRSQYSAASAAFARVVEQTEGWGNDVDTEVIRGIMRAYLESLAQTSTHAKP